MKTKRQFHKLTAWLLTLAMLMTIMPGFTLTASAATDVYASGSLGQYGKTAWTIYDNGLLVIDGKGNSISTKWDSTTASPWKDYADIITRASFVNCENWVRIPENTFRGLSNLKEVILPENIEEICQYAFTGAALEMIILPERLETIGNYAFSSCESLNYININDGVTSIGSSAFYNCSSLKAISIPDSVTSIGQTLFQNCGNLEYVRLSERVDKVGGSMFLGCTMLKNVSLPASVTVIGSKAFSNASNLAGVYYHGTVEPTTYNPGLNNASFSLTPDTMVIYASNDYSGTTMGLKATWENDVHNVTKIDGYFVNVAHTIGGAVKVDKSIVPIGDTVTVDIMAYKNYVLDTFAVTGADGNEITVTGDSNTRTFSMPEGDVTITATFKSTIVPHVHSWTFEAEGTYINATCANTDGACHNPYQSVVITPPSTKYFAWNLERTVTVSGTIEDVEIPEVVYTLKSTGEEVRPFEPGVYVASLTIENTTLTYEYEITKSNQLNNSFFTYTAPENLTYDGTAKIATVVPNATVDAYIGDVEVLYNSSSTPPVTVGTYTVTLNVEESDYFTAKTNLALGGRGGQKFSIVAKDIEDLDYTGLAASYPVGATPDVTIQYNGMTLEKDTDYTLEYANNTVPGTATITVTGIGNYTGTKTLEFEISAHEHSWNYELDGTDTIKATCTAEGCTDTNGGSVTIVAPTLTEYGGTGSNEATVTGGTSIGNINSLPDIVYYEKKGDYWNYLGSTAPSTPGTFKAELTVDTVSAFVEYTIAQQNNINPMTPVTISDITSAGFKVTVAEADRDKKLEYHINDSEYRYVTPDADGSFILLLDSSLAGTEIVFYIREAASEYIKAGNAYSSRVQLLPTSTIEAQWGEDADNLNSSGTLAAALAAKPAYIRLQENAHLAQGQSVNFTTTIDLNGYAVNAATLNNTGNLTVTGSGSYNGRIENNGTLVIDANIGGDVESYSGKVTVTDGKIQSLAVHNGCVTVLKAGTFNILKFIIKSDSMSSATLQGKLYKLLAYGKKYSHHNITSTRYSYDPNEGMREDFNGNIGHVWFDGTVSVLEDEPVVPDISTQPADASYLHNYSAAALSVTATNGDDGGILSYQWYSENDGDASDGTAITGATDATYIPPTDITGITYYYCVVANSKPGYAPKSVTSNAAKITVEALSHTCNLTYTATGSTITAVCQTANCPETGAKTIVISASDKVYDGTAVTATVTNNVDSTDYSASIVYEKKTGTLTDGKAVNSGTYTAKITVGGATATVDFTISKAQAVISVDVTPIVKTYGEALTLPTATTNFGTVSADKTVADMENAGEYTVTYTVAGNDNYNGDKKTVSVTINPKKIDKPSADNASFVYDGNEHTYNVATSDYYTITGNKMTNAGSQTVTVALKDKVNYTWNDGKTDDVTFTFNIAKKDITGATVGAFTEITYTGGVQTPFATVTIDGLTVTGTWSDVTNVAETTTFTANGNFTGTIADKETGMLKADPTYTEPTVKTGLVYNGSAQELLNSGTAEGGTMKYYIGGTQASETVTTGTSAGEYTVNCIIAGDENHNNIVVGEYTVTIAKKSIEDATVALDGALTYNGAEQTQNVTVTLDGFTVTFDVTDNKATNVRADGNYTLKVTANGNFAGEKTLEWNIAKADHIIEGDNIPTASRIRRGNKLSTSTITPAELKDADGNVLGTFTWVTPDDEMTETGDFVKQVKFTPGDTTNYNEKTFDVTVTVYRPSSDGGYSNTSTTTTKNADGSTTKVTENKTTGTKTEVTTNTDGSTTTVETKKDGTVTTTEKDKDGNTVTTVEKSDGTSTTTEKNKDGSEKVTEEKADGTTVTTEKDTDGTKTVTTENVDGSKTTEETKKDGTTVKTETNADGETTAEVKAKDEIEVVIPVENAETVYEVVVTDENGNETVITDFETVDGGIAITAKGNVSVSISKGGKKEFVDIHPVDHWSEESVDYVYIRGLMKGTSETHFSPDATLTRAMLVTVLYRLEGEPATNRSIPFADIDMGAYYANAVVWAQQNGIVKGISETEFAPNDNITREQIAAIMHRYATFKGYDVQSGENTNILSYDDFAQISEYAISSMQYACGSGILRGKTTSTLDPLDNATRAEIAAILHRFIEANK